MELSVFYILSMVEFTFIILLIYLNKNKPSLRIVSQYLLIAFVFNLMNAMFSYDINGNRILFAYMGLIAALPRYVEVE